MGTVHLERRKAVMPQHILPRWPSDGSCTTSHPKTDGTLIKECSRFWGVKYYTFHPKASGHSGASNSGSMPISSSTTGCMRIGWGRGGSLSGIEGGLDKVASWMRTRRRQPRRRQPLPFRILKAVYGHPHGWERPLPPQPEDVPASPTVSVSPDVE